MLLRRQAMRSAVGLGEQRRAIQGCRIFGIPAAEEKGRFRRALEEKLDFHPFLRLVNTEQGKGMGGEHDLIFRLRQMPVEIADARRDMLLPLCVIPMHHVNNGIVPGGGLDGANADLCASRPQVGEGTQLLQLLLRRAGKNQLCGGAFGAQFHCSKVFRKTEADAENAGEQERCQQHSEDRKGITRPVRAKRAV